MQHRGEIIRTAVLQSGIPVTTIAKRLGKSRRWMYLMYENPIVSLDVILEIGRIIHHDFSTEVKELNGLVSQVQEPTTRTMPEPESVAYWKNKYLELLEQYLELLRKSDEKE